MTKKKQPKPETNLRARREGLELTQFQLAAQCVLTEAELKQIGVNTNAWWLYKAPLGVHTIRRFEACEKKEDPTYLLNMSLGNFLKLARGLGISPTALWRRLDKE